MISTEYLGIVTAFLFILVMLVVSIYTARVHWGVKAAMTVGCLVAVVAFHKAWVVSLGWPVDDTVPEQARFIGVDVVEPVNGRSGHIYLWLVPDGADRPRSYRIPYTRGSHRAAMQAAGNTANGQEVYIRGRIVEGRSYGNRHDQEDSGFDFIPPPTTPMKN